MSTMRALFLKLGDDVQTRMLKWYVAFRRIKSFASVEVHRKKRQLVIYVRVGPSTVPEQEGFTRDVRRLGHYEAAIWRSSSARPTTSRRPSRYC